MDVSLKTMNTVKRNKRENTIPQHLDLLKLLG